MKTQPRYIRKSKIIEMYNTSTAKQMANYLGISIKALYDLLHANGIKPQKKKPKPNKIIILDDIEDDA